MMIGTTTLAFSNPNGQLPRSTTQPISYFSRLLRNDHDRESQPRGSTLCIPKNPGSTKPRSNPHLCHDWIFSSASNVHVAIDHSIFKTYTPFKSYVLAVADHRRIPVEGIGSVDLELRRKKGARSCHAITLDHVLHVPDWICNVFSDVYFDGKNGGFEHTWISEGVQFKKRKGEGKLRNWGFTEEFCGLERLVLARKVKGRSPMMEDPQEVFSINVNWPQGQRDRWERFWDRKNGILMERDGNIGSRSRSLQALKP